MVGGVVPRALRRRGRSPSPCRRHTSRPRPRCARSPRTEGPPGLGRSPPPRPRCLDLAHGRRDPGEPALHRPTDLEPPRRRTRRASVTPALSVKAAHSALVTEQDFVDAQQIRATRPTTEGQARRFALADLIHCGVCDRRLDSRWNHRSSDLPLPPRPHQHATLEPTAAENALNPRRPSHRPA